jgi:hypothetical protein
VEPESPTYLRWALFEAALHTSNHPVYVERYQRTKQRLGRQRGPKVARIELSRKAHRSDLAHAHLQPALRPRQAFIFVY